MGRRARQAAFRAGAIVRPVSITDRVSPATVAHAAKATATRAAYERFVSGREGWLEWTAAQGVESVGLDEGAADRVARFYYFRTHAFTLGLSTAGQLLAAVSQYFHEKTSCGGGTWSVIAREGESRATAGNPVRSTVVNVMKLAHKQAKARAGEAESDTVDVIEPVHIRTFFTLHFRGRLLEACGPHCVLLHAALLMGMSLLLRFNELSALRTDHMGRSEGHFTFSIKGATKNSLKKKVYELMPWPTALNLDPRYVGARLRRFRFSLLRWRCLVGLSPAPRSWMSSHGWLSRVSNFIHSWQYLCLSHRLDPVLAFATWMRLRGGQPGYIFCDVKEVAGRLRLYHAVPMSPLSLVAALRRLYAPCGVLDPEELATHTPKRSGVQLYEAIHQTHSWIMEKGGWADAASFMRYRALCNRTEQRDAYARKEAW